MKKPIRALSFLLVFLVAASSCSREVPEKPDPVRRKSPTAISNIKYRDTYIKATYGQPYKNGRVIFGELVPYGKLWRTGANEATEITTTDPVWINDKKLAPGTYSMFTIPDPDQWTVIFNAELGQWGAFEYDSTKDVLRVTVPARQKQQTTEVFTIQFEEVRNDSTAMVLVWDQTEVRIPLEFGSLSAPSS